MRTLRDLLTTWENWSAHDTLIRARAGAPTQDAGDALCEGLAGTPEANPLEALRDAAELVALLSSWQWQTMHAARLAGSSWTEIGVAIGTTSATARDRFLTALDSQEAARPGSSNSYREAL